MDDKLCWLSNGAGLPGDVTTCPHKAGTFERVEATIRAASHASEPTSLANSFFRSESFACIAQICSVGVHSLSVRVFDLRKVIVQLILQASSRSPVAPMKRHLICQLSSGLWTQKFTAKGDPQPQERCPRCCKAAPMQCDRAVRLLYREWLLQGQLGVDRPSGVGWLSKWLTSSEQLLSSFFNVNKARPHLQQRIDLGLAEEHCARQEVRGKCLRIETSAVNRQNVQWHTCLLSLYS